MASKTVDGEVVADVSPGVTATPGDIMVQVKTAFDDFDSKFSDSEASEAVYLSFASSDVTLDDVLVTQEDVLGDPKYGSTLFQVQQASPSGEFDIGITNADMIDGTSTKN